MAFRYGLIFSAVLQVQVVEAAVTWIGRESTLNTTYLVGAGPVVRSDNVIETSDSMTDRFAMSIADSDGASGLLLGLPWSGEVSYSAAHEFEIIGSPLHVNGVSSAGRSTAIATFRGPTSIGVNVRAPGNSLALEFDVTRPVRYILQGEVGDTNTPNTAAGVSFQRFSNTWVPFEIVTDNAGFFETGELSIGRYRIVAYASAVAGAVASAESGWNMQLTFVPLPSAVSLFAGALGIWVFGGTLRAKGIPRAVIRS